MIESVIDRSLPDRLFLTTGPEFSVESSLINSDAILVIPKDLVILGRHLVVADAKVNPALHVINLAKGGGAARVSFGRFGQGPGEFLNVGSLHAPSGGFDLRFWVHDYTQSRLTLVKWDTLASLANVERVVQIEEPRPQRIVSLTESLFVGTRTDSVASALTFYNSQGRVSRTTGTLLREIDSIPSEIGAQAYSSSICYSPEVGRIALAYRSHGRLSIYEQSGSFVRDADVPLPFSRRIDAIPVIGIRKLGGPNERVGYSHCSATPQHIFALFSGKLERAFRPNPAQAESEFVHVFDWNGRFLGIIRLDHPAVALTVDPLDGTLYTGVANPQPMVRASMARDAIAKLDSIARRISPGG